MMNYWNGTTCGAGGWVVMAVGMALVLIVGVLGAVWAVRALGHKQPPNAGPHADAEASSSGSASQILDERFARGEIDEDEYRRRRDMLQGPDLQ